MNVRKCCNLFCLFLCFSGNEDDLNNYNSTPVRQSSSGTSSSSNTEPNTQPGRSTPLRSNTTGSCTSAAQTGPLPVRQTSASAALGSGRSYSQKDRPNSGGSYTGVETNGDTSKTYGVQNDFSKIKKGAADSPLKALSLDTSSKQTDNNSISPSSSSPYRPQLSYPGFDQEPLNACVEEPNVNLEEPDYSAFSTEKLGRLQFSVSYDFEALTLTVKIIKAEDLAAKDLSGTSDPYVKISLLPDKRHTLTTNIKRKNLNPRWNEVFAFEGYRWDLSAIKSLEGEGSGQWAVDPLLPTCGFPYNKVVTKTLYLVVIDYDRFSRDDPIGEVCIPLSELDLQAGPTMWRTLQPCKGSVGKLGVLLLSLCYQPAVGCITIVIIKARDLKAKDINGLSDPYVKIWLMHEGKKVEKKKTVVKDKTLNPNFNETFVFTVPYERIRQTSLVVSVMDYDRMGRNEAIGQIILGTKSGPMEMKHWNEMFAKSRQNITQWHILKDFG